MVDELLVGLPPERTEPEVFWGEQFDRGLAWVHFPVGRGGLGVSPGLQGPVQRRILKATSPGLRNMIGYGMVAPTLVAHGTDEQHARYLRPIFTCEEIWCQLFTEPGAGSDVASLSTRAERDGDEWVLNGQKVWTTLAHLAQRGLLMARTDPDLPKHRGMTCFLVDMDAPGVEVRPLLPDHRRGGIQRGLLHRRPDAGLGPARRDRRGLAGGRDDPHERAGLDRRQRRAPRGEDR